MVSTGSADVAIVSLKMAFPAVALNQVAQGEKVFASGRIAKDQARGFISLLGSHWKEPAGKTKKQ